MFIKIIDARIKILTFFFFTTFISINAQNINEKYHLVPWPKEISENNQKHLINKDFLITVNDIDNKRVLKATTQFLRRLSGRTGVFIDKGFTEIITTDISPSLLINFQRAGKLELYEDESYQLIITSKQISLNAVTDIGVLRGLETLLQLVSHNKNNFFFHGVSIKDAPRFPWRGLMIDVARHYEPIAVLKKNLDAMAAVKLNVFHWHLTEDQGFRVQIKSRPKFHELASDGQYYTHSQISEVVQYASDLGIRVVPEFDVPGHATSWLVAYPEIASKDTIYEIERYAGIFDPTLDPTNDKTYEILDDVFTEMAPLFPDKYFHIGGDENEGKHWDENKKIQKFKKEHELKTNHDLQTYFNIKVQKILEKNGKIMMGWDEIFQPDLPKNVVIHSWRGRESMISAAKQGYKTVLSKGFYIDLMLPIKSHYLNEPIAENHGLTNNQLSNILGGEATMWGELVTPLSIDSRIWPRTAAIAERLWSSKDVKDYENMLNRLHTVSYRLEELGITHIRNRDVILRNISDNQNIKSLINLTKICEPLKAYERNKGGKEYKTYSPFTLFVDACNTDAIDAINFNKTVKMYLKDKSKSSKETLINFLDKWVLNNIEFQEINNNPLLKQLTSFSLNLAEISTTIKSGIEQSTFSLLNYNKSKSLLMELKKPIADTELAIILGLESLIQNFGKEYVKS
tara:strand:- start:1397 stop:3451 length:2055 start_codon:yes stop_codon:yes gene_type:complete